MSSSPKISDALLDEAIAQVRDDRPDEAAIEAAADRVWNNLNTSGTPAAVAAAAVTELRDDDDYVAMIPAYLAGTLSPARTLLLEEQLRQSVTLRRALNAAREGKTLEPMASKPATVSTARSSYGRLALAAMLAAGLGLVALLAWQIMPFGSGTAAVVETVDGTLFRVAESAYLPIEVGAKVGRGEHVRAGRDGGAVLTLDDGSRIELKARSEVSIEKNLRGTTVRLERGNVIVQAAKQRSGKLYVATEDCLVSVVGTIFSVNHGTKGSRVSVIEGEVRVDHSGDEWVLHPGDQVTTHARLGAQPVDKEIEWSRDIDYYLSLLSDLASLRKELREGVPHPELRYESRLLDLMPQDTMVYVAVPNLGETLRESYDIAVQSISESPALETWRNENGVPDLLGPEVGEIVDRLSELGGYLGAEMAVGAFRTDGDSGSIPNGEDIGGPLVLSEVTNPNGLRTFVDEQIDQFTDGEVPLVWVDDPFATAPADETLFLWLAEDMLTASPDINVVRSVAEVVLQGAINPFVGSPFHSQIEALYADGAGIIVAVDLEGFLPDTMDIDDPDSQRGFAFTGLDEARHLMLERKVHGQGTEHRAVLSFREQRHGIASWLAAPAPMGSLDFISPDAKMFGAFVIKDPSAMLDDVHNLAGDTGIDGFFSWLEVFEQEHGLSLREDFAETLGGEMAFAIDGPLLPIPSWKLVLEVYDPARFQFTIEQAIEQVNGKLTEAGKPIIELQRETVGGRDFYTLPAVIADVHYTFVEGYLVMGPSRALVDRALRYRQSGQTITHSPRFVAMLPTDQRDNFSALIYQDLTSLLGGIVDKLPTQSLTPDQQAALEVIREEVEPTLIYAYGEPKRIIFAAASEGDLLTDGLLGLLGLAAPLTAGHGADTAATAPDDEGTDTI